MPILWGLWRFARIIIGYGIVYGVNALIKEISGLGLPVVLIPLVSAALNALAKYIRVRWKIDLKII